MVRKKKRSYKTWTTNDDNTLISLRSGGASWAAIGKKLGVSSKAASARGAGLRKKGAPIPTSVVGRKPKKATTEKTHVKSEPTPAPKSKALSPLAEVDKSLGKLRAYIALLEARNASLQSKLDEIEKTLRD